MKPHSSISAILALATVIFAFGGPAAAVAQETGQITGRVVDGSSGAAMGQVQVYLPEAGLGSLTRSDGRFIILNVPVGTHEITARRIGFGAAPQTVAVTAGATAVVNFELTTQALGLDEIVVTGTAGTARRREIGNAIAQLDPADIPGPATTASALLQASAPGISVVGSMAAAGQGQVIRLRGMNSVEMDNQPIIYIDGIRVVSGGMDGSGTPGVGGGGSHVTPSPLNLVNPSDIERIEIIKGSAATTLYGTEAAAGVIQIFTKRGSSGSPVWTAEIQQGTGWMREFGANGVNYLHMEHFMRDAWWGGGYEGGRYGNDCVTDDPRWEGVNGDPGAACSWPGSMWLQNYLLSVRGGNQTLEYYVSGQFQNDTYILPQDSLKKYSFRGNFTMTPLDGVQVRWNTAYTHRWQRNTMSGNNLSSPTLNSFRQEANYTGGKDPRIIAKVFDFNSQYWIERVTTGLTLNHTAIDNLTNRITVGYDFLQQEARNLMPFTYWVFPEGSVVNEQQERRLLTLEYVSTYHFDLNDDLASDLSWGGQAVSNDEREVLAQGRNFPGAAEPTVSSGAITLASEDREKVWNAGFFAQNIFGIYDRYFITAGLRVDGNSAFGEGFGLQVYPKVSGSWVVSDEAFWPEGLGMLKLRGAYGQSGRAPGAFDAVRTWEAAGFIGEPAFEPENRGNPDLGPEVTTEFEAGFDAAFLEDRVSVVFTYYDQTTRDALIEVSGVPSQGFANQQLENVGTVGNSGMELQVNAAVVATPDWGLDANVGLATNDSEILELVDLPQFQDEDGLVVGRPLAAAADRRVANPTEIGPWVYANGGAEVLIGSRLPTLTITPRLTLRVPGNIQLSALGEYRGGYYREINPIPIQRTVRSPLCYPYYVNPLESIELKESTPALWRERCSTDGGDDYWFKADNFKLRSITATAPLTALLPESIANATLTLSVNNIWQWYREIPWYDVGIRGDSPASGLDVGDVGGQSERIPAPATFNISLRFIF